MPKRSRRQLVHKARRFDRQTHTLRKHGGAVGRSALPSSRLLFDCLDYATGQLDPSYDTYRGKTGICRRTVADALRRLKRSGLLNWQQRITRGQGRARRVSACAETNAYACCRHHSGAVSTRGPPAPPPERRHMGRPPAVARSDYASDGRLRHGAQRSRLVGFAIRANELAASLRRATGARVARNRRPAILAIYESAAMPRTSSPLFTKRYPLRSALVGQQSAARYKRVADPAETSGPEIPGLCLPKGRFARRAEQAAIFGAKMSGRITAERPCPAVLRPARASIRSAGISDRPQGIMPPQTRREPDITVRLDAARPSGLQGTLRFSALPNRSGR